MNTPRQLILAGLLTLCMTSCSDYLELSDPNAVPTETFLRTEGDMEAAINGVYQALRHNNALGQGSALFTDERSDDMGRNDNQSNSGEPFQFNDFSLLPSNTYLWNHWQALYEVIARANYVITLGGPVDFEDESRKTALLAEVRFLRGLTYYHLVRKWGAVPLVLEHVEGLDELTEHTFREKEENVYAAIVEDLRFAAESPLPDHQPEGVKGRVSKAAAYALLGEVYLTMGSNEIPGAQPQERFELARQYLMSAYEIRDFGKLSEIAYQGVFDVEQKHTNPGIIFQIVYRQGDPNLSSPLARNNQALGETINSQYRSTGSGTRVNLDLVNEYEEDDPRKAFSVKFAEAPTVQNWFITKFRDTSDEAGPNGYGGNDHILMRYADVILLLAEVNWRLGEETAAVSFLDLVRERAGLPSYAESRNNPWYNQRFPDLKAAILHERRVELAFEHKRWYDLIRMMTIDELTAFFDGKKQAEYGVASLRNFGTKDRYYPIPFDEYKLDSERMYQNPGYD